VSVSLNNLLFEECQGKIYYGLLQVPVMLLIKKTHEFYQETINNTSSRANLKRDRWVRRSWATLDNIGQRWAIYQANSDQHLPPPWPPQAQAFAGIIIKSTLTE